MSTSRGFPRLPEGHRHPGHLGNSQTLWKQWLTRALAWEPGCGFPLCYNNCSTFSLPWADLGRLHPKKTWIMG